jgi:predicted cobalt transporter CbtA
MERIASVVIGLVLALIGCGVIALDAWKNGQLHGVNGVVGVLFVFAAGLLINTPKTKAIADAIDDKAREWLPTRKVE